MSGPPSLDVGGAVGLGPGRDWLQPWLEPWLCLSALLSLPDLSEPRHRVLGRKSRPVLDLGQHLQHVHLIGLNTTSTIPTGTHSVEDRHWAPVGSSGTSSAPDLW